MLQTCFSFSLGRPRQR